MSLLLAPIGGAPVVLHDAPGDTFSITGTLSVRGWAPRRITWVPISIFVEDFASGASCSVAMSLPVESLRVRPMIIPVNQ